MSTGQAEQDFITRMKCQDEPAAQFFGTRIVELTPGHSRVVILMRPEFANFYGVVFGGIIMSLADQAFGCAVNSLNYPSVAAQFNTYFLESARVGDELTAVGQVVRSGRTASVAEVEISNQDGKLIAMASGTTIAVTRA
jgi:acyl-CoA thioesterase